VVAVFSDDDLLPISALQHLVYCPRQCALIHIERLWVENRLTAEGRVLHERTHAEGSHKKGSRRIARGVMLRSLCLGLFGQADTVEFLPCPSSPAGKIPFPVEYKRGKPKPHDADEVQLCAQTLCLEEMLSCTVATGALFYGKTRRRVEVTFDEPLRQRTIGLIANLRELVDSRCTPRAAYAKGKCGRCSMLKVCMPEVLDGSETASRYLQRAVKATLAGSPADDW
jgi:CRISPR-associated exonuclease Cas4